MREEQKNSWQTVLITFSITYLLAILEFFWLVPHLPQTPVARYGFTIGGSLALAILAFWALRRDRITFQTIGVTWKHCKQAMVLLVIIWGIAGGYRLLKIYQSDQPLTLLWGMPLSVIITHWLFVGLSEELLFRGYLFTRLRQLFTRQGRGLATGMAFLFSSLIFAIYHIPQRMIIAGFPLLSEEMLLSLVRLFLLGMILAWLFYRTTNGILVGLIHGGLNAPLWGRGADGLNSSIILVLTLVVVEVARMRYKPKPY